MSKQIFVNLPVKDLNRSIEFFTKLGFSFNQQFTNADATCMVVSDNIFFMLLVEPFFKTFTAKDIVDAHKSVEVINCLSADSRADVDDMVDKAIAGGGKEPRASQDHGWMYNRAFQDLDGHLWEIAYMDESAFPKE